MRVPEMELRHPQPFPVLVVNQVLMVFDVKALLINNVSMFGQERNIVKYLTGKYLTKSDLRFSMLSLLNHTHILSEQWIHTIICKSDYF